MYALGIHYGLNINTGCIHNINFSFLHLLKIGAMYRYVLLQCGHTKVNNNEKGMEWKGRVLTSEYYL